MAKKILELKSFLKGIVASPSDADIPEDSPVFSKNIDAISEEGKLKGVKGDKIVTDESNRSALLYLWKDFTGTNANPILSGGIVKIYINNQLKKTFTQGVTAGFDTSLSLYQASKFVADNVSWGSAFESVTPVVASTDTASTVTNMPQIVSANQTASINAVSYTHLTLPTKA